jgi:DNA-directed RNA polymerase specialized sigma24 family protein
MSILLKLSSQKREKGRRMRKVDQTLLKTATPIIEQIARGARLTEPFAYYTREDVYQEVWAMCVDALSRYNPDVGELEHFLRSHVSRRIKNLKRDRYFRPGYDLATSGYAKARMNVVNALPLDDGEMHDEGVLLCAGDIPGNPSDELDAQETMDYLVNNLPPDLVPVFYALINKNTKEGKAVDRLRDEVRRLLAEREEDA